MKTDMTSEVSSLSAQILDGMKAAGWTQTDLAEAIGTNQPDISAIILGKRDPGWAKVCRMAEALGITITADVD